MKIYHKIMPLIVACFLLAISCNKKATDFQSFLGSHEIVYPGVISGPASFPGNGRILLTWHPNSDPSVNKYIVYWNNYADSLVVRAVSHNLSDTVKCVVNNLAEYAYTFFVYSFDSVGNKSIATEIDNARVYGAIYQGSLHNRLPDNSTPYVVNNDGSLTLNFNTPDTINIATNIKYTNTGGVTSVKPILPDNSSITLSDYEFGTQVLYQSSYIPVKGALDTFYTAKYDTFPPIFRLIQCDKSLFKEMTLPTDMGIYESDTRVSRLWDGSVGPQGYPNIFHSDGGQSLPQTFSFDMGKVYNRVSTMEETGRNCCNNPTDFEVWGIADTTGAMTSLASNNSGWKADAIARGWTLLKEVVRSDDGSSLIKVDLISTPVRFVRFRVLQTATGSNYVNLSELTFWDKQ